MAPQHTIAADIHCHAVMMDNEKHDQANQIGEVRLVDMIHAVTVYEQKYLLTDCALYHQCNV